MRQNNRVMKVRRNFFNSILKDLDNWRIMYIAYRYVRRVEPLLYHYSDVLLTKEKIEQINHAVEKKINMLRLRMIFLQDDVDELEAFAYEDAYCARLFSAVQDYDLPVELFNLFIEITKIDTKSIPYPANSVVKALESLLNAAYTYSYYTGSSDECGYEDTDETENNEQNYDDEIDDIESDNEVAYFDALDTLTFVCDSLDYLGKYGWNHLFECFVTDLEYLSLIKNVDVTVFPERNLWTNGEPRKWLDLKKGEIKKIPINRVFISYAWIEKDDEYNYWIDRFIKDLTEAGLIVIWDKWNLELGNRLDNFMKSSVEDSEKVILLFTPEYAKRADNNIGGVGNEWNMISAALQKNPQTKKFIGVLKSGSWSKSLPSGFENYMCADFTNENEYDNNLINLIKSLFDIPNIGNIL